MTRSIRFHDEAIAEIRSAATWYEEKRSGLGSEFLDAVEARVEQLARLPSVGGRFPDADLKNPVRRVLITRFPYAIVFVEVDRKREAQQI